MLITTNSLIMVAIRDPVAYAYSGQSGDGSLPYFVGKQYGAGWLRSLARIAFPILKKVVGFAGNVAANTAEDMIEQRKSFKDSLRDNTLNAAQQVLSGKGKRRKRMSINIPSDKRIKTKDTIFSS